MLPEKIIISRTDSIGDVVLTLPVAGLLKKHFPSCKLIFLGKKYTRPVIDRCEHIDEFSDWDEIKGLPISEQKKMFVSLGASAIIHVFPDKKIASLAKAARIPLRIGTSHRVYHLTTCNRLLNFGRKNSPLHEAQLNLKLLSPFGIPADLQLSEFPALYGFTNTRAVPAGINDLTDKTRFNLVLHPRSKGSAREWGLDNFSKLIEILPAGKFKIFITGTKADGESMKGFLAKNQKAEDLTGRFSLEELISFLDSCDGLVAASTGPLHIAAALGKKAIGIYAPMRPIHPGRWMPLGQNASCLVIEKNCSDCRKDLNCHCIREISAEQVRQRLES